MPATHEPLIPVNTVF